MCLSIKARGKGGTDGTGALTIDNNSSRKKSSAYYVPLMEFNYQRRSFKFITFQEKNTLKE